MLKSGNGNGRLVPLIHKVKILQFFRRESTALHFYQNRQLELYASKEAKRLTLRQLVRLPSIRASELILATRSTLGVP